MMKDHKGLLQNINQSGYRTTDILGQGSYGVAVKVVAYNAVQKTTQNYACKVMFDNKNMEEYYGVEEPSETVILSTFKHPHLIELISPPLTISNSYIPTIGYIMPLGDFTLRKIIHSNFIGYNTKMGMFYKIADAMNFLHENRCLHLDLKPENIIIFSDSRGGLIPKIIDFGMAICGVDSIAVGESAIHHRVSLEVRSPELLATQTFPFLYNGATDVWSFGILFLSCLSNKPIYRGKWNTKSILAECISIFRGSFSSTINTVLGSVDYIRNDFFKKVLAWENNNRISFNDVLKHPFFLNNASIPIEKGMIKRTNIHPTGILNSRHHINTMIACFVKIFPSHKVKLLFSAIDLYYRAGVHFQKGEQDDIFCYFSTCIWMACKFQFNDNVDARVLICQLETHINVVFTAEMMTRMELGIIHYLGGVIYKNDFYHHCKTKSDLQILLYDIILNKNEDMYGNIVTFEYFEEKINELSPKSMSRTSPSALTIHDFFA